MNRPSVAIACIALQMGHFGCAPSQKSLQPAVHSDPTTAPTISISPLPTTGPAAALLDAAIRAGDYMTQAVRADGRFVYEYDPATDLQSGDYNILRHAGATYAMSELYAITHDANLRAATERALDFLLTTIQPGRSPDTSCVVEDGFAKLGGSALAVIALAKHAEVTGEQRHVPMILALSRWLLIDQELGGRFAVHKQRYADGQPVAFESAYYPGEAIYALCFADRLDPAGSWRDAAARGAKWVIETRDAGKTSATIPHDHWLLYAMSELYRHDAGPAYASHAMLMTRGILDDNVAVPTKAEAEDATGPGAEANRIATRIEGLCAAYDLLISAGEADRAAEIRVAVGRATGALRELQITSEAAKKYPRPARIVGGFRSSTSIESIRIDTVQHATSALLGATRIAR